MNLIKKISIYPHFFKKNNKAFTVSEVIIATFISIIILWFIFIFLSNILNDISWTKREVAITSSIFDFTNKLNNFRSIYKTWSIIVDNIDWSDIFLMKSADSKGWVLLWPISLVNSKLETENGIYLNKWVWFRMLSEEELAEIDVDVNVIYTFAFQRDQIFPDLKTQDLVLLEYNWWDVYDMTITFDTDFQSSLVWELWQNLPKDSLKKFNINF